MLCNSFLKQIFRKIQLFLFYINQSAPNLYTTDIDDIEKILHK